MKKITLSARIKGLQLRSRWYGLLFALTRNRRFFDRKIKAGVLMLSLLNMMASCGTPPTGKTDTSRNSAKKGTTSTQPTSKTVVDNDPSHYARQAKIGSAAKERIFDESEVSCYMVVEKMPSFPGGQEAMINFLNQNTQYPSAAIEKKMEGTVFVQFIVDSTGKIEEPKVIRSVSPELDNEALRVVRLFPHWNPGIMMGEKLRVGYTMPFKFVLEEATQAKKDTTQTNQR
ncbi:energy transducer TonB [uncultured Acetobacteroides sp.]|uniref:energy transducer TonB n=1 Tax=uncultured Acetobacteroides sp. TaxID=1760811 RepID=UPI0029F4B662|nr:energy transducer TonB [uncultured Acetobacteroides sp.]